MDTKEDTETKPAPSVTNYFPSLTGPSGKHNILPA
jgi:hypothetical protein